MSNLKIQHKSLFGYYVEECKRMVLRASVAREHKNLDKAKHYISQAKVLYGEALRMTFMSGN